MRRPEEPMADFVSRFVKLFRPERQSEHPGDGIRGRLAWAFGGRAGVYVFTAISGPLIARMLTPDSLGDYFLATTIAAVGSLVALLGLTGVVVREISAAVGTGGGERARSTIIAVLRVSAISAVLTAAILASPVGRWVASDVLHSTHLSDAMPLVAVWTVLSMAQLLVTEIWRGFNRIRLAAVIGSVGPRAVFSIGVAGLWLAVRHVSLETLLWLWICSQALLVAVGALALASHLNSLPSGSQTRGRGLVGPGLAILMTGIMWQALDQFDVVILANAAPRHDVALYGAAGRISMLLAAPLLVVEFVLPPLIGAAYARGQLDALEVVMRRGATIAMIPTAVGAIAVLAAGRWILEGFYGAYYARAWAVLVALTLGDVAFVVTGSCGLLLWMTGHQRLTAWVSTVFAVATLGAAIGTAHVFGMLGLAVTMGIGIAGQNFALLLLARRRLGIWTCTYVLPQAIGRAVRSVSRGELMAPTGAPSPSLESS